MKNNIICLFCLIVLLLVVSYFVFVVYLLNIDDVGVQGVGGIQLEMNIDWSKQSGEVGYVGVMMFIYGVIDKLDLFFNLL